MSAQRIGLSYGVVADTLEKQVNELGFTLGRNGPKFEKCRKALHTLRFGIDVPDGEYDKLCRRLHKRVISSLEPRNAKN